MAGATVPALKLVLCGNGSVGKTSIIRRFVEDGFDKVYHQTVGLDLFEKVAALKEGASPTRLQIWDIGGQSIGSKMLDSYLGGMHGVFLCYDTTDSRSFDEASDWLGKVQAAAGRQKSKEGTAFREPAIFLVGNKADLIHLRQVPLERHEAFIRENSLQGGFIVSALNGDRIVLSFYAAAAKAAGLAVSDEELAVHEAVVGFTVAEGEHFDSHPRGLTKAQQDEARRIEEEDTKAMEAQERALRRAAEREAAGGCGCVCM
jgi:Ras-related protein Rab-28